MSFPGPTPQTPEAIPRTKFVEFLQDVGIQTYRLVEGTFTPDGLELTYLVFDHDGKVVYHQRTGEILYTVRRVDFAT